MTVFPRREAEILALGQNLIAGLTANVVDFPAPEGPTRAVTSPGFAVRVSPCRAGVSP